MKLLFIGDSITEGQGSGSYVEYVAKLLPGHQVKKLGISGTTIGEYSLYPVEGDSLLYKLKTEEYKQAIRDADLIYLEYGCNDISAVVAGNVTYSQVLFAFVKAIDAIHQINCKAQITFLALSCSSLILQKFSKNVISYLNEYYKAISYCLPSAAVNAWAKKYQEFIEDIQGTVEVVDMILSTLFLEDYLAEDKLHPTLEGYEIIAYEIVNSIKESLKY